MISVYNLKSGFQNLLKPLLKFLRKIGITPNQLTLFAVLLSIGIAWLILNHPDHTYFLLLVGLGLLVRMGLNALDGMMAKTYNLQSKLGEILNETGDIISDSAIILSLVAFTDLNPLIIILFMMLAVLNEFAGVLAKAISGVRRYDGPMGKSDRALLIGLFCLITYFLPGMSLYADWIFGIACILVIVSTVIRLKNSLS